MNTHRGNGQIFSLRKKKNQAITLEVPSQRVVELKAAMGVIVQTWGCYYPPAADVVLARSLYVKPAQILPKGIFWGKTFP